METAPCLQKESRILVEREPYPLRPSEKQLEFDLRDLEISACAEMKNFDSWEDLSFLPFPTEE